MSEGSSSNGQTATKPLKFGKVRPSNDFQMVRDVVY